LSFDYTRLEKLNLIETIISFVYILICNILLFVGVGSSALLSQQISKKYFPIVTSYIKGQNRNTSINDSDNKSSDDKINHFPFFNIICITTIVAYLIKYLFSIMILKAKNEFDNQIYRNNTDKYNNTDNLSIYYEIFYENENDSNKTDFVNNNEINNNIYSHDKILFINIIIIYILCIILSSLI
jgi:hypothetical protein